MMGGFDIDLFSCDPCEWDVTGGRDRFAFSEAYAERFRRSSASPLPGPSGSPGYRSDLVWYNRSRPLESRRKASPPWGPHRIQPERRMIDLPTSWESRSWHFKTGRRRGDRDDLRPRGRRRAGWKRDRPVRRRARLFLRAVLPDETEVQKAIVVKAASPSARPRTTSGFIPMSFARSARTGRSSLGVTQTRHIERSDFI